MPRAKPLHQTLVARSAARRRVSRRPSCSETRMLSSAFPSVVPTVAKRTASIPRRATQARKWNTRRYPGSCVSCAFPVSKTNRDKTVTTAEVDHTRQPPPPWLRGGYDGWRVVRCRVCREIGSHAESFAGDGPSVKCLIVLFLGLGESHARQTATTRGHLGTRVSLVKFRSGHWPAICQSRARGSHRRRCDAPSRPNSGRNCSARGS